MLLVFFFCFCFGARSNRECQHRTLNLKGNEFHVQPRRHKDNYIIMFIMNSLVFLCILPMQPAVLENLLSSMKFVLSGMGLLRVNLEKSANKVSVYLLSMAFLKPNLSCNFCHRDLNLLTFQSKYFLSYICALFNFEWKKNVHMLYCR